MAELNFISDSNTDRVPSDIAKNEYSEIAQLKSAALQFLKNVRIITYRGLHIQKLIDTDSFDNVKIAMKDFTDNRHRELVQQQYLFESKLNNFLGRTINLAWVDIETGNIYYATEVQERKLYQTVSRKGEGRAAVSSTSQIKDFERATDFRGFNQKLRKQIQARQNKYREIFQTVIARWTFNHSKETAWPGTHLYYYNKYRNQIWWNEGGIDDPIWNWSDKKVNRGHISQAYVNLVMGNLTMQNNQSIQFDADSMEENVKRYYEYMKHYHVLNNTKGITSGDVKLSDDGSIQFSVKAGASFNTASIIPYIKTAYIILALDYENLTKQNLENQILYHIDAYYNKLEKIGAKQKAEQAIAETVRNSGGTVI